jgi:DNA-binding transcriptional ArsR family regulator
MIIELTGCSFFGTYFVRTGFFLAVRAMTSLNFRPMDRSEVEKISKALADKTRLRIFEVISATDHMNCGEIVSVRGVTPATVSHHLKILSDARLIACRREGQFVYSESVPETIAAYTRALMKIAGGKKAARSQV